MKKGFLLILMCIVMFLLIIFAINADALPTPQLTSDLYPSLNIVLGNASYVLANNTEGSNLGLRLAASVLAMDFNTDGENYPNLPYKNSSLFEQGTYVKDGSVYNNFGTSSGITAQYWWTNNIPNFGNPINGSLQFDGGNDYINVPITNSPAVPYTFSMWFNPTSTGYYQYGTLIDLPNNRYYMYDGGNCAQRNTFDVRLADGSYFCSSQLTSDTWHNAVVVANSSGTYIYIDGILNKSSGGQSQAINSGVNANLIKIGGLYAGYFKGSIDDVILWNRSLSSSEITDIYNKGLNHTTINQTIELITNTNVNLSGIQNYYNFSLNESGNATDLVSGKNMNCSGTKCPTWVNSTLWNGGYYDFNGLQVMNTTATINGLDNFTLSVWLKANSISSTDQFIWSATTGGTYQNYLDIYPNYDNIYFSTTNGSDYRTIGYNISNLVGTWVHVVAVRTRNAPNQLYINGIWVGNSTTFGNYTSKQTGNTFVGARSATGVTGLNGSLDEFIIYNRSLTATEISNLYDNGKLRLHLNLDENNGTIARDSFISQTATLTNYPLKNATSPIWNATGGQDGSGAYQFDGVNDYLSASATEATILSNRPQTFSIKFKPQGNQSNVGVASWSSSLLSTGPYWLIQRTTPTTVKVYVNNNYVVTLNVSDNVWTQIDTTYDSNNTWKVYQDGVFKASQTGWILFASSIIYMGVGYNGYFNGTIDQIKILSKALNDNEIMQLYNGSLVNNTLKYSSQNGSFTSGVFYNDDTMYWNNSLSISNTSNKTGILNNDLTINVSNANLLEYLAFDNNLSGAKGKYNATCLLSTTCPNNATGLNSPAIKFTGVTNSGLNGTINTTNAQNLTISMWVYPTSFNPSNTYLALLDQSSGYSDYIMYFTTSSSIRYLHADTMRDGMITGTIPINLNNWYHVVAVFNQSSKKNSIYVNGVLDGTSTASATNTLQTTYFYLGTYYNIQEWFNGTMDEVIIYNKTLTSSEIQQLYKSGLSQHGNTNITQQIRTANSFNSSDPNLRLFYTNDYENMTALSLSEATYTGTAPTTYVGTSYFRNQLWQQACNSANSIKFSFTPKYTAPLYTYVDTYNGYAVGVNITMNTSDGNQYTYNLPQAILPSTWRLLGYYNYTAGVTYNMTIVCNVSVNFYRVGGALFFDRNLTMVDEKGNLFNMIGDLDKAQVLGIIGSGGLYSVKAGGQNTYYEINDSSFMNQSRAITYATWIYPLTTTAGGYTPILEWYDATNGYNHFTINNANAGSLRLYVNNIGFETSANVIQANKWQHIAGTWDNATGQARIYVNGVLVGNSTISAPYMKITSKGRLGDSVATSARQISAYLDQIRIYNRSLSQTEIQDLYNVGESELTGWSNWSSEQLVSDNTNITATTNESKFIQYKWNLYTNTTDVSPYLIQYNISTWNNSCIYRGGNWNLLCSDQCRETMNYNIEGNVSASGTGYVDLYGKWNFTSSKQNVFVYPSCSIYVNKGAGWN